MNTTHRQGIADQLRALADLIAAGTIPVPNVSAYFHGAESPSDVTHLADALALDWSRSTHADSDWLEASPGIEFAIFADSDTLDDAGFPLVSDNEVAS